MRLIMAIIAGLLLFALTEEISDSWPDERNSGHSWLSDCKLRYKGTVCGSICGVLSAGKSAGRATSAKPNNDQELFAQGLLVIIFVFVPMIRYVPIAARTGVLIVTA